MGAIKNSEFAQMQGAGKICEHPLRGLPAYPTSPRRICMDMLARNFLRVSAAQIACLPRFRNAAVGMQCEFWRHPNVD
jgi:hypothetical protein